jgi:hypothetical protein
LFHFEETLCTPISILSYRHSNDYEDPISEIRVFAVPQSTLSNRRRNLKYPGRGLPLPERFGFEGLAALELRFLTYLRAYSEQGQLTGGVIGTNRIGRKVNRRQRLESIPKVNVIRWYFKNF